MDCAGEWELHLPPADVAFSGKARHKTCSWIHRNVMLSHSGRPRGFEILLVDAVPRFDPTLFMRSSGF